uniref:Uncharacterized protein n=1 Tax=Rhizophora mucronata TaxID=61149 RepID=A0A2P2QW90_RHIMU
MQIPKRGVMCLWFSEETMFTSRPKSFLASRDDFWIFMATGLPSWSSPLYTWLHPPFPIIFPEQNLLVAASRTL